MNPELETLIKERYALLPDDLKKAITSLPMQEIMQGIANENGLLIDQSGDLYMETMLILLGVEKVSNFEKNLKELLKLDSVKTKNISQAINEKVFMSVRESLRQMQELQDAKVNETEKKAIMSEIENPTPTIQPISVPTPKTNTPMVKPVTAVKIPDTTESVARDFIAGKLTQTVNLPSQKVNIQIEKKKTGPEGYPADPYREPIK